MAHVIERVFTAPCEYDDIPSTFAAADALAGKRLDRRKNYGIVNGKVCEAIHWTHQCSGCDGFGCHECGYQGKARDGMWVPIDGSMPGGDYLESAPGGEQ